MAVNDKRPSREEFLKLAEQFKRTEQAFRKMGSWDTWICTVDLSGFLEGDFKDFPSHIQDGIHRAMEMQCKAQPGQHIQLVVAKCYQDMPDEPPYLRIVVQAFPNFIH